jgi:hypothetical protein
MASVTVTIEAETGENLRSIGLALTMCLPIIVLTFPVLVLIRLFAPDDIGSTVMTAAMPYWTVGQFMSPLALLLGLKLMSLGNQIIAGKKVA